MAAEPISAQVPKTQTRIDDQSVSHAGEMASSSVFCFSALASCSWSWVSASARVTR